MEIALFLSTSMVKLKRLTIRVCFKDLFVLVVLISLFWSLAFWQLSRATEQHQLQLSLIAKSKAQPVALLSLDSPASLEHQSKKVVLTGRYIDKPLLIQNACFKGQRGYEVFIPFELTAGGPWVLVGRGWHIDGNSPLPSSMTETELELIAEINVPPSNAFFLEPEITEVVWPFTLHHFQLKVIRTLYDAELSNFVLRLEPKQPGALDAHWAIVGPKGTNHVAYALQWFAFSIIALLIYIIRNSNAIDLIQEQTGGRS
jgi:cytochrome oxidase assembly protein ShyY1